MTVARKAQFALVVLYGLVAIWRLGGVEVVFAQTPTATPRPPAAWINDPYRAEQIPVESEEGVIRSDPASRSCRQHGVHLETLEMKWTELHCYVRRVMEGMAVAGTGAATLGLVWGAWQYMADSGGGSNSRPRGIVTMVSAAGGLLLILSAYIFVSLFDAGISESLPFR